MIILTIRTDQPESEIGLFSGSQPLTIVSWEAHRQLAESIHTKIESMLNSQALDWHNIEAVACYKGPGSFTGLRIGISVGNALAYSLNVPIIATTGNKWQTNAVSRLLKGDNDKIALPEYGSPVHITLAKN